MTEKENFENLKNEVNKKHIRFYDKTLSILEFILNEYSKEIIKSDIEYTDIPKNTIATLDFLISAIGKVQKGQRLALGLDIENFENTEPIINVIESLNYKKI